MSDTKKTVHGAVVETVKMRGGKDYVTVAGRVLAAHDAPEDYVPGWEMTGWEMVEINSRFFIKVEIDVKGKRFTGTSEIKFNATSGADKDAPLECAETSAVGRALGFAGLGVVDGIATADEIAHAENGARQNAPQAAQERQQTAQATQAAQRTSAGALVDAMRDPNTPEPMHTDRQMVSIRKLCTALGRAEPADPDKMTFAQARELLTVLSHDYSNLSRDENETKATQATSGASQGTLPTPKPKPADTKPVLRAGVFSWLKGKGYTTPLDAKGVMMRAGIDTEKTEYTQDEVSSIVGQVKAEAKGAA